MMTYDITTINSFDACSTDACVNNTWISRNSSGFLNIFERSCSPQICFRILPMSLKAPQRGCGKIWALLISSNEIDETGALRRGSEKSVPLVNEVDRDLRMSPDSQRVKSLFLSFYFSSLSLNLVFIHYEETRPLKFCLCVLALH